MSFAAGEGGKEKKAFRHGSRTMKKGGAVLPSRSPQFIEERSLSCLT